mgnify:CR=1 FL=1
MRVLAVIAVLELPALFTFGCLLRAWRGRQRRRARGGYLR